LLKSFLILVLLSVSGLANNVLNRADSLYLRRDYRAALDHYKTIAAKDRYLQDDFSLNFKLGICYLSNAEYEKAHQIFSNLRTAHSVLPEYLDYHLFLTALKNENVSRINSIGTRFLRNYNKHYLADSLRYYLAEFQFARNNYSAAANYYTHLVKKRSFKRFKSYFSKQIALCRYNLNRRPEAYRQMYQIIKKYKNSEDALEVLQYLEGDSDLADKYFFTIADVYLAHGYYTLLRSKLENYIRYCTDENLKEKARFYLLQMYYYKNEYQKALYGLKNLKETLRNKLLEPRVLIMIARCYLYLDKKDQAAIAYIDYAEQYPRRRLADDAIWKAAWIYEEQGNLKGALKQYNRIIKHWTRSAYYRESKFRIGITYYRLGWLTEAEKIFREIVARDWSKFHNHRGTYWLAKTYAISGKQQEATNLYVRLGGHVFETYYATRSYLLHREQVDSLYQISTFLRTAENPIRENTQSIGSLLAQFQDVILIKEILGEDYAYKELARKRLYAATLPEWIALAEIYKRLGAYNRAYRIYDYIDKTYFNQFIALEKPFILKEAYPLYFDDLVINYSDLRNVNHNLVMAVIRAESAYDQNAHSWADAYGLMQIIPRTADEIARELHLDIDLPENLLDPETNINLGTYYLTKLLKRFDNRITYALAAYNAGPHRVEKWRFISPEEEEDLFVENIEFNQTRNYVRKVLLNFWIYEILSQYN